MKAAALAEAILRDRDQRKSKTRIATPRRVRDDFDPFGVTCWRVVAGGDPSYLVATPPMHMGPVGWFIACRHCCVEFESRGGTYCATCMDLPAEERRSRPPVSDRQCQSCGNGIPKRRRADAKYCSPRCSKRAENGRRLLPYPKPNFRGDTCEISQQNQGSKTVLIGPGDWPINLIGGYRGRARELTWANFCRDRAAARGLLCVFRHVGSGGTGARPNGVSPRVDASPEAPMVHPSWFMRG
jgi:hypothetical protein